MSAQRPMSCYMRRGRNMDKRPSVPTSSMDSLSAEIKKTPVSWFIDLKSLDDHVLMQCDDLLDKEESTCFNDHENISLESRSLLSASWSCSTDSVLSEAITSSDQDVDEVITSVCQSLFDPDFLTATSFPRKTLRRDGGETEAADSEEKEEVQTTDESLSSSSTETAIAEAAKTLVSLVYRAVNELEATKAAKTLQDIGSPKTQQSTDGEKALDDTRSQAKRCFSARHVKVHPAPPALDEVVRPPTMDWTIFCTEASKQGSCDSQETTTITSSSGDESADLRPIQQELVDCTADEDPTGAEKTKAKKSNRFFDFFRNVFSKKNFKKKNKVAVEENPSKLPSSWIHKVLF